MRRRKKHGQQRHYDPISDRYTLSDVELANLALGSALNAAVGHANAARVHKLASAGRSARDIVLITGLSRATVYRALRRLDNETTDPRDPLLL